MPLMNFQDRYRVLNDCKDKAAWILDALADLHRSYTIDADTNELYIKAESMAAALNVALMQIDKSRL